MTARILAYHRVSDRPAPGLETWAVRPAVFQRQLKLLRRLGYRGVCVRELLDAFDAGDETGKLVAITFDDGYLDTVEIALPLVAAEGFTASVYVVPEHIGGVSAWEPEGARAPLANWDDLHQLVDAGWEIGMHSNSHPERLDVLTGSAVERELFEGVNEIENKLQTTVETFAFPHGHYSSEATSMLERRGYRAALTTESGAAAPASHRFTLPRYEIKRRDTLFEFSVMILTGIPLLRRRETLLRIAPTRLRAADSHHTSTPSIDDAPSPSL